MSDEAASMEQVELKAVARRRLAYSALALTTSVVVLLFLVTSSGDHLRGIVGRTTTNLAKTSSSSVTIKSLESSSTRVYYDSLKSSEKKSLFDDFKTQYAKSYETDDEEATRYKNFKKFLKLIDSRNDAESEKDNTAVHGVTQFADLSETEVKKYLLGYKASSSSSRKLKLKSAVAKVPKYTGSATTVDWAGVYTTSVSDQGYCGSCWAYSATEQLESDSIRLGYLTTDDKLSVQQLVSCDTVDLGCLGGNTETAYSYIEDAGGVALSSKYPYTSYFDITGTCTLTSSTSLAVTLTKYYTLTSEDDMQDYVLATGPLSICAAASSWTSYKSGVVSSCDTDVDHCVQLTGVNTDSGYWIVRNSWGASVRPSCLLASFSSGFPLLTSPPSSPPFPSLRHVVGLLWLHLPQDGRGHLQNY